MANKTIILDVDGPLAKADEAWLRWLEGVTSTRLSKKPTDYDLTKYFKEELGGEGITGFEFWKGLDVYRNIDPVEGSIEACEALVGMGYRLLPVSKVYAEHTDSKRRWLKKYYPMLDEPIYISLSGHKSDIRGDIIIDDRIDNFLGFDRRSTRGILFTTPYKQKQNVPTADLIPYYCTDNWEQIVEVLS